MTGFTPGPWEPRRAHKPDNCGGYDWAIVAPEKAFIAECFQVVDYATQGHGFNMQPVEANAHLIAAAPELLGVAERILERGYVSEQIEEERDDHLALMAIIAKAKGETT